MSSSLCFLPPTHTTPATPFLARFLSRFPRHTPNERYGECVNIHGIFHFSSGESGGPHFSFRFGQKRSPEMLDTVLSRSCRFLYEKLRLGILDTRHPHGSISPQLQTICYMRRPRSRKFKLADVRLALALALARPFANFCFITTRQDTFVVHTRPELSPNKGRIVPLQHLPLL